MLALLKELDDGRKGDWEIQAIEKGRKFTK
jgi:hypothetical protein